MTPDLAKTRLFYGHYPLHDARERPLHIIVAGAGPSGIALAIDLMNIKNVTFQIFEKNSDVGGTWLENRYPGVACDVASHPINTHSNRIPTGVITEEIGEYFKNVARGYAVYPDVQFNSRVNNTRWDAQNAKWTIGVVNTMSGEEFESSGDLFINAGGISNNWEWPDIEGLTTFGGLRICTAAWDLAIPLKGKKVGIIGSGATSVQVVPASSRWLRSLRSSSGRQHMSYQLWGLVWNLPSSMNDVGRC
ncbi:uncharacterized protein Z519_05675 [Cladophialophora bantiana CBS 173.52]|uniref:FAD/NAD(P)-binding domain-containing protein n=1 Tax=Cladophialophora bantiana (strain ATCC 10958 / CBS 173.52 / CDC B-1940 / NIH 8579) TaxID=1442370 RepID=A0A0D2HQI3_CLAB1|nr:uncharacterized protein Z519_05675 [Cladophialophora bantiana CBS 173.52]KIW93070.1 hypothetical protein Z519_05675 [Cladophialophora bantiana CBS 173.52]